MSEKMRKYIDDVSEYIEKRRTMEVIVSYDCSDIHHPFGSRLLSLLRDDYNSIEITQSNYKIGQMLNITQIAALKQEISNLFEEVLNESVRQKRTVVKLIIPLETQFIIEEVINQTEV